MNRDTQFLGFAGKVIEEMMTDYDQNLVVFDLDLEEQSRLATILARRAYDLVGHTCQSVNDTYDAESFPDATTIDMVGMVPDLTELPEVTNG